VDLGVFDPIELIDGQDFPLAFTASQIAVADLLP